MAHSNPTTFQVCLTRKAHLLAKEFSKKQKSSKAQQVYHNTLSVWAVAYFMKCMQIKTDWSLSDSWDIITQSLLNVADLVLPGIGKLECRAFIKGEQNVYIPLDASLDRIAYVVVELDNFLDAAKTATILGFVKIAPQEEEFPVSKLESLKELLKLIEQTKLSNNSKVTIQLSKWLDQENKLENKWLSLAAVFKGSAQENLASSIRSSKSLTTDSNELSATATRGKKFNLGVQVEKNQVALVITIAPGENENIDILAQVYAINSMHLPKRLKLVIIDENEDTFLQAEARNKDQFIQLEFFGKAGEKFKIKLSLEKDSVVEHFVI